jgi:large subunit ribosomal protein L19
VHRKVCISTFNPLHFGVHSALSSVSGKLSCPSIRLCRSWPRNSSGPIAFAPGDTVRVQVKIKYGDKERLQAFEGMVIACRRGPQGTFTVRKMSFGQGVERIFPFNSKVVDKVEKIRSYEVRRAKLFYLRGLRGKAARLREVERKIVASPARTA